MGNMSFLEFIRTYNGQYKESNELYHRLARHFGLSDSAFWILYTLRESEGPVSQKQLCQELYLSKQTVNSALKNLEEVGYLRLESAPDSRKNKEIHLTDAGEELLRRTADPVFAMEERAFCRLTEEEREAILRLGRRNLDLLREEAERLLRGGDESTEII